MNLQTILSFTNMCFLLALTNGCTKKGVPNPNDSTAPSVQLQFKGENGKYTPELDVKLFDRSKILDVRAIISDPDGLKAVSLSIIDKTVGCPIGGTTVTGSSIQPLPPPQNKLYPSGTTLQTQSPLFLIVRGPFYCRSKTHHSNGNYDGVLKNADIVIKAEATNWSSNKAVATTSVSKTVRLP